MASSVTDHAEEARQSFALSVLSEMEDLNEVNYESWIRWKPDMELVICLFDLDFALAQDKPSEPTDTSSPEEKAKYEKWEKSNRLILFFMKRKMGKHIYANLDCATRSGNAKQFFAALEDMLMNNERIQAPSMLKKLVGMRYDGQGNVSHHLNEIASLARRLRAVDVGLPEYLINRLALDSLPSQFDHIRFVYSLKKEKWGLDELARTCSDFDEAEQLYKIEVNPLHGKRGNVNEIDNGSLW